MNGWRGVYSVLLYIFHCCIRRQYISSISYVVFYDNHRLGIKASRTASVPSIVHRKPFGVVTSITGDTTIPRKGKWSYTNFIQSFGSSSINFLQRKWKYQRIRAEKFRRWMTQRRIISLPYGYILPTNVSSITGHMSFIMLAFSFMESDVVLLRSYAIGAISASILFQYYRAQPLWIPISWNVIFLLINGAMITALIRERQEASHLEPAEAEVYSEVYDKVGTDPVEFLRVIRRAERCMVSKGTILAKAGDQQKKLYLIVNGQFKVYDPDGMSLGTIRSHQYIGSMAFLRFMYSSLAHDGHHKGGIRALVAAHHPTNHEDEKKNEAKTPTPPRLASDCLADAVVEAMESMEAEAGPLKGMVNDTNSTNPAETVDPNFEKECICRSTVISEKASDVYVWDFKDLADYFRDHPKEQNAMTVSIGADLTEKIDQSRDADINYYHFLNAALRFGEVLPLEKKKLQMFRKEHRISLSKHESMLNELGWTKNDFDEGVQNKEVSSNFTRYIIIISPLYYARAMSFIVVLYDLLRHVETVLSWLPMVSRSCKYYTSHLPCYYLSKGRIQNHQLSDL